MQFRNLTGKNITIIQTLKINDENKTVTVTIPPYKVNENDSPKSLTYTVTYNATKTESVPSISGHNNITMTYDANEAVENVNEDIQDVPNSSRTIEVIRDENITVTFYNIPNSENGVGFIVTRYVAALLNKYRPRRKDFYYPSDEILNNETGAFLGYSRLCQYKNFYPSE